jgi:hypothetical protein
MVEQLIGLKKFKKPFRLHQPKRKNRQKLNRNKKIISKIKKIYDWRGTRTPMSLQT